MIICRDDCGTSVADDDAALDAGWTFLPKETASTIAPPVVQA